VNLNGAYLGTQGITRILKGLRNQIRLHTLELNGNNLRDEGAKLVFEYLKTNNTLTRLCLEDNNLVLNDDWVLEPLASSSLSYLSLASNNINEGEAYIAKALATSTTMLELNIGNNKFESAVMISGALATNKSLEILDMRGISLKDFGAKQLVSAAHQNESLIALNLQDTKIGYDGVMELTSLVKSNSNILLINVAGNLVSQGVITAFHNLLSQRWNLTSLHDDWSGHEDVYDRLTEDWIQPLEDDENHEYVNEVEEIAAVPNNGPSTANNSNEVLLEPKPEKTLVENIDYSTLEVFQLDDWFDFTECVNFVEKYPEIRLQKVVPHPFGLQKMKTLYNSAYRVLKRGISDLEGKKQEALDQSKKLLTPVEHMQLTKRSLELERTLLNQKIEKLEKEFKKKAEGFILHELNSIRLTDRHSEAVQNFDSTKKLKSKSITNFNAWQVKLNDDISTWSLKDVETFLGEAEIAHELKFFKNNQITGGVLVNLTTEELINDLNMTFHAAKRLQLFILMVKAGKSIYDKLPPVLNWENEEVCRWLNESGFSAHEEKFKTKNITGIELFLLDKSDLAVTLEIPLADRGELLRAIKIMQRERDPFKNQADKPADKERPPRVLICPITKNLMTNPVQASDGHTYERSAIEEWFKTSQVSPVTKEPLKSLVVIPSHTLKTMLDNYNSTLAAAGTSSASDGPPDLNAQAEK
jgi:sacsin